MAAELATATDSGGCAVCGGGAPGAHVCDLELLLSCYVELDPTPHVYGELLAHWLANSHQDPLHTHVPDQ